ncbi:hypothetical protein [Maribacter sp. HTCC2170]|uniref:hypothetical protein n=1 Tax=Maribacter sp. (strain HTCC2170 / KCCM 42371) TaxID=313603 RepID=UPI00006B21FD|nr:hypothetical protein [Maribacter sp. HTCC2170]EAR00373.1 hypothetical protein FB2170_13166 [Maribacter sp. HTCC2170]
MKTYSIVYAFLALVVIGCSKSSDSEITENKEVFFDADYVLLQKSNGILSAQLLQTNEQQVDLSHAESSFQNVPLPTIYFTKESIFAYYTKLTNCSGQVMIHDFEDDISSSIDLFDDLMDCDLTATSLAVEGDKLYVSYLLEETSKIDRYYVRVIDLSAPEDNSVDVELDKKPLQMVFTNNRLFVLTFDLDITDENALAVIDGDTDSLIHEIDLGYDVEQIFADTNSNLIISYLELHTVLNSSTMNVQYIGYEEGKEPMFYQSKLNDFDSQGRLFYKRPTDGGTYDNIPAIYDFANNLSVLYYYENFLTESQLEFEFKIGDTSMVSYDNTNSIMLVGYQKIDDENKGGLLRIQLDPVPEFLDNLDLDAVPIQIFYQD